MDGDKKTQLRQFYNFLFGTNFTRIQSIQSDTKNTFFSGRYPTAEEAYNLIDELKYDYEKSERKRIRDEAKERKKENIKTQEEQIQQEKINNKNIIKEGIAEVLKKFENDTMRIAFSAEFLNTNDITNEELLELIFDNVPFFSGADGLFLHITFINNEIKSYPLNQRTRELLNKILVEGYEMSNENGFNESDKEVLQKILAEQKEVIEFEITNYREKHNNSDSGAFFKYFSKLTKVDLRRYGITNCGDNDVDLINENCLFTAFKNGGMKIKKLEQFKTMVLASHIPVSKLEKIADDLNIQITLKKNQTTKHTNTTSQYGKNDNENYNIGLIDEHYFIIEPVKYNSYAIDNYFSICDKEEWYNYRDAKKKEKRYINSFDLIKLLIINKETHLKLISGDDQILLETPYSVSSGFSNEGIKYAVDNIKDKKDKEITDIPESAKITWSNCFIDFETRNDNNGKICPFMGVIEYEFEDKSTTFYNNGGDLYSDKCVWDLLNNSKDNTKFIIQNANFDFSFIIDKLYNIKILENAGRIIVANGLYKKKNFMFIDFINFSGMSLADCGKSFKLDIHKEYIPYRLYDDIDVLKKQFISIEDTMNKYEIKDKNKEIFLMNIDKWKLKNKREEFDALGYCKEYCILDVKVLKQSYLKFKSMMINEFNISIDADSSNKYKHILTISSLAKKYAMSAGYFDGCIANDGVIRNFIQQSVVGGRTMVSENKKKIIKDSDAIDANSLYPSAIKRLGGFLKGKPKMITNNTDLSKVDGYNVYVKILSHKINRKMPLFSFMEKGSRIWNNDMDGKCIYIGKIGLEDLVKYHGVEYEIIQGIYWDEGRTTVDIDVLYQKRLKYKRDDDVKELVYKLVLNSIYGFTLMKEHREGIEIKNNKADMEKYVSKNYNWIISAENIKGGNKWLIKETKETSSHENYNHIGVEVLDMSKRIMNEVVCELENDGFEVTYGDTDSCFMTNKAVEHLKKTKSYLFGEELGQFKCDFGNGINIIKGYLLGKKAYYVKFNKADKKGKTEKYRMKGVPSSTIEFYSKQNNISIEEIYKKLFNNEKITFDLCEKINNISTKFKVEKCSNRQLEIKKQFTRTLSFN